MDQDLVEFERLQAIARAKRAEWEAATTDERRHTLLNEVLSTTVDLVNHEESIPSHRRLARVEETARRWRRVAGPGVGVLAVTAAVTLAVPWVSSWWAVLPLLALVVCGLLFVDTVKVAEHVDPTDARLVTALVVVAVSAGTLTALLVPLLPGVALILGSGLAMLSTVGLAVAVSGSSTAVAVFGGQQ